MARKLLVKVCGMRELENTREIALLSPDLIGFIFVPDSKRYVEPKSRSELIQSVPATIKSVAVFKDAELSEVVGSVRQHHLKAVQLHGSEDSAYIAECRRQLPSCYILKAISLGESKEAFSDLPTGVDLYIFDGLRPGSGEGFDWRMLEAYRGHQPFLLAGGLGVESLEDIRSFASKEPRLLGIDINSKVESSCGVKDRAKVERVISGVRI